MSPPKCGVFYVRDFILFSSFKVTIMRYVLGIILLIGCLGLKAQKHGIIFYNDSAKKAVQVKTGGMVMLSYKGYLKQDELNTNYILQLNDSVIVLGKPRLFNAPADIRQVRIKDITGFRKVSEGTQLFKFLITLGGTLGSYYAFSANEHISTTEKLVYSTAVALGTQLTLSLVFPSKKVKYKIKDGWRIMLR
jgi:hypothetical protein